MGAEWNIATITDNDLALTDAEIITEAHRIFEDAAYENGHGGYSGSFAEKDSVKIHRSNVFEDISFAEKWISDLNTSKWDQADIVPVLGEGWLMAGWCSS